MILGGGLIHRALSGADGCGGLLLMALSGGSAGGISPALPPSIPQSVSYYNYESSVSDYEYDGSEYHYSDSVTVPADSIVFITAGRMMTASIITGINTVYGS